MSRLVGTRGWIVGGVTWLLVALGAGTLHAQDTAPAPAPAAEATAPATEATEPAGDAGVSCLECHDGVDAKAFAASPHAGKGEAACRACHGSFALTEDGHDAPDTVACTTCHKEVAEASRQGVHMHPRDDGKTPATCTDCHGVHDIRRAAGLTNGARRALLLETCGACHEAAGKAYQDGRHGRSENEHVASCVDCHGAHQILSSKDPQARTYRLNQATMCTSCHLDAEKTGIAPESVARTREYLSSAHGLAIERSGLLVSATCVDCHGAHSIADPSSPGSPVARVNVPHTCGKCHQGVQRLYEQSVHGTPLATGNSDVPVCTDCHGDHGIKDHREPTSTVFATKVPETCLKCHADQAKIAQYDFPGLRAETYRQSYHGAAATLGDTDVANCASCHEAHDIRRSSDARSATNPANIAHTCGKCHKTADPQHGFVAGKIHIETARESHWITALVERVYLGLITVTIGFFVFFIAIDLRHHARRKKRR